VGARHRVAQDDFTIRSQNDLLATATPVTGFLTRSLGAVAGISLLVGGIGIMNIMLVSVGIVTLTALAVAGGVRRRAGPGPPSGYATASPVTSRQVANRVCSSVW
jgi:hypothetical protein